MDDLTRYSANLPMLGNAVHRQVAEHVDFDSDGLRDIAVWYPPSASGEKGEFRVYLSSTNWDITPGTFLSMHLGEFGDVPLVADFNSDGVTDVPCGFRHGYGRCQAASV